MPQLRQITLEVPGDVRALHPDRGANMIVQMVECFRLLCIAFAASG